ncbi:MAG: hypothetical protein BWK78_04455 [Thiotrichaceae bacterium IS1]|nr:MAG: hypothetical protein BWK78_04455 [Thiotrichaceae bacterium IS1]
MRLADLRSIVFWKERFEELKNFLIPDIHPRELLRNIFQVMLIVIPVMFIIIFLFTCSASTIVHVRLLTDRITFNVVVKENPLEPPIFLEPMIFKKIAIQTGFLEAKLHLKDQKFLQIEKGQDELLPSMQMEVANPSTLSASLTGLELKQGSKITLEYRQEDTEKQLYLEVWNDKATNQPPIKLNYGGSAFSITTQYCLINGEFYSFEKRLVEKLSPRYPAVEVKWQDELCSFLLTVKSDQKFNLLSKSLDAKGLEFLFEKLENSERILKSTIAEGTIYYPQTQRTVEIGASRLLLLDEDDQFYIERVVFNPALDGIELYLSGIAKGALHIIPEGLVYSEDKEDAKRDYRLTYWDTWVESSPLWKTFLNMIIWLFPAVLGLVAVVKVEMANR